jgi:peptidoglycan hydrolase CwlO-like protein
MAKTSASPSREILEAALQGLESQRNKLDEQISEVRRLLSGRVAKKATKVSARSESAASSGRSPRKKRALSQEARARIAAAQKKRWAAFRKNQA